MQSKTLLLVILIRVRRLLNVFECRLSGVRLDSAYVYDKIAFGANLHACVFWHECVIMICAYKHNLSYITED